MVLDSRTYSGTVSGIIRGSNGAPVSGCFVGLYAVTGEGAARVERLIAATKTNAEGKYLFGGVTGGKYIVKAKRPHKPRTAKARGHLPALFYSLRCAKRV